MVVAEETFSLMKTSSPAFKICYQSLRRGEARCSLGKGPANTKPIGGPILSYATNEVTQLVTGCESSKFCHPLVCWNHFLQ